MTDPDEPPLLVAPIRVIRTMAVSIMVTPVLLAGVVLVAVPGGDYPPPFLPLVLGGVAVGGVLIAETAGYAAPPIDPRTSRELAARAALHAYRTRWLVRSLATEIVVLIGLLLSFMLASRWPYLVAFVLGLPIMFYELWPARRLTDKLNLRLEADGARSHLEDALHGRRPGST